MAAKSFDEVAEAFGVPMTDVAKLRRELAEMTTRAARAEARIAAVLDLIADPGESHRMLGRAELRRLLRD